MLVQAGVGVLPSELVAHYPHGYAVVDVETSGLSPTYDRVLQVAVVQVRADGAVESVWSTLLDPGCDPGPVHIHGLTRGVLRGSPLFADVANALIALISGRVLVAHNARFDWDFLASEASRAHVTLPVASRLCTIALSRRLDLPLPGLSLEVVSAYWGVERLRAHDAVDDTRVLVEVLRHSLALAHRLDATLPLTPCTLDNPRRAIPPSAPRQPCQWLYPGRWIAGTPLVQGMKIAFTGDTDQPREVLIRRGSDAGLDVMNNVSSRTSVLVLNEPTASTGKADASRAHGTPIADEITFLRLLDSIATGQPKTRSEPAPAIPAATSPSSVAKPPPGRLAKLRILILGGGHEQAAGLREQIAALGGQTAANLTASVTHVVPLDGARGDPRWARAIASNLAVLDPATLEPVSSPESATRAVSAGAAEAAVRTFDPIVLGHGAVSDLPADVANWSLCISWRDKPSGTIEIDVVAFVVDLDEQVRVDEDFCFYNQPVHPTGAVDLELGTPNEVVATIRPNALPDEQRRVIVASSINGEQRFGDVGPIELTLRTEDGLPVARATLDAASKERSLLLATIYERNGTWRLRAIGQGYQATLAELAVMHGVDIED